MTNSNLMLLLALSLLETHVCAATGLNFTCKNNVNSVHYRCSFPTSILAGALQDSIGINGGNAFNTSFVITYRFPCKGNPTGLSFKSGNKFTPIEFGRGPDTSLKAEVEGSGDLTLTDANPKATYCATLEGSCNITIVDIESTPSIDTLYLWRQAAAGATISLKSSLKIWQQSKHFDQIVKWDTDQLKATKEAQQENLTTDLADSGLTSDDLFYPKDYPNEGLRGHMKYAKDMPESWHSLVLLFPDIPDIVALLSQIDAILDGRPPVYDAASTAAYRADLEAQISAADRILALGGNWKVLFDKELKTIYNALLTQKANAEKTKAN